jgi:hypothetical protein
MITEEFDMRPFAFAAILGCLTAATGGRAAEPNHTDLRAPEPYGTPSVLPLDSETFAESESPSSFDRLDRAFDDEEIRLVQREEPITGSTLSEDTLRLRAGRRQAGSPFAPRLSPSTNYYGTNSLLGAYGGYGPVYGTVGATGKRCTVSIAQTADYVTNLALPIFITTNNTPVLQNDFQFQTNVYAQSRIFANERHSLITGFNYYQSLHPSVEQLDLWAYTGLARYTRAVGDDIAWFFDYDYTYYLLNHDSLLSRNRVGPGLSVRTWERVQWLMNYSYSDNKFRADDNQSSDGHFATFQRYQFFGARNHFLLTGSAFGTNNANLDAWSYDLKSYFAGGALNFGPANRWQLYNLTSYGDYDFEGFDLIQPGVRRKDEIWTNTLRLSNRITNNASLFAQWTYFVSNSNVTRQDFDSHLFSIGGVGTW